MQAIAKQVCQYIIETTNAHFCVQQPSPTKYPQNTSFIAQSPITILAKGRGSITSGKHQFEKADYGIKL